MDLQQAGQDKERIEAILQQKFVPLKDGTVEKQKEVKTGVSALVVLGKEVSVDESLLAALPTAIGKKPADRAGFDIMVVEQFEKEVATKISELQTKFADGAPAMAERAA